MTWIGYTGSAHVIECCRLQAEAVQLGPQLDSAFSYMSLVS